MIHQRRRPFTMFEMLVVMALITIILGVVAININKAVVEQRFRTEVSSIVSKLRLAQNIMLILKTDVRVIFQEAQKGEGIEYWLEMDTKLPTALQNAVQGKKNKLVTVKGVFFHDDIALDSKQGRLDVKFLSNGAVMSRGIMRLASSDIEDNPPPNVLETYLCLPGYPSPIRTVNSYEEADKKCQEEKGDFNRRLTEEMMALLPDKVKKKSVLDPPKEQPKEKENKPR